MPKDISHILDEWPTKESETSARRIVGDDGTELLQLRIDLGVLQMYFDGRPDGDKPCGQPSLLEHLGRVTGTHQAERMPLGAMPPDDLLGR